MGIFSSKQTLTLTNVEIKGIRDTWSVIVKDLEGFGVKYFMLLFKTTPETQRSFPAFAHVPITDLGQDENLKTHALAVMMTVDKLVSHLNDVEFLIQILKSVGENHGIRGVQSGVFQVNYNYNGIGIGFKATMLNVLADELQELWTPIAATGWTKFLTFVATSIDREVESLQKKRPNP